MVHHNTKCIIVKEQHTISQQVKLTYISSETKTPLIGRFFIIYSIYVTIYLDIISRRKQGNHEYRIGFERFNTIWKRLSRCTNRWRYYIQLIESKRKKETTKKQLESLFELQKINFKLLSSFTDSLMLLDKYVLLPTKKKITMKIK